jgi:hypothetical protein
MPEFDDLDITRAVPAPPPEDDKGSNRSKWILLILALLLVAGFLGYVALRRPKPEPVVEVTPPAAAAPRVEQPGLRGDDIPLPPLDETDSLVRDLVSKLSQHPTVMQWLATPRLIETFTVVTLNVSQGTSPVSHLQALKPTARFRARTGSGGMLIDPTSYQRYDTYAAAVDGLDPTNTARLYLTLKPRIIDAYRALGNPEGDFDPVFERAVAVLLRVPRTERDIAVAERILSYEMLDPNLEDLQSAQKHLLRMGPRNTALVQEKLRQIAQLLGLHPESVRLEP